MNTVLAYKEKWLERGYQNDIPQEVPEVLAKQNLAPSYKAIAIALLKNDIHFHSLGFSPVKSDWYSAIKRIEIAARNETNESL